MLRAANLILLALSLPPFAFADVCDRDIEGVNEHMEREAVIAAWNKTGLQRVEQPYVPRGVARNFSNLMRMGKVEEAKALLPDSVHYHREAPPTKPKFTGLVDLIWVSHNGSQTTIKAAYSNDHEHFNGGGMRNETWALWPMIKDRLQLCDEASETCRQNPGGVLISLKQRPHHFPANSEKRIRARTEYRCRYQFHATYASVTEEITVNNP